MRAAALIVLLAVSACQAGPTIATAEREEPAATRQAPPIDSKKETSPMEFRQPAEDRLPPPEVQPVERDGVRYLQSDEGHGAGASDDRGILLAVDAKTGARLWTLTVYATAMDPKLEADVQWVHFTSMAFDADGRLRISNEAGKRFLVDVEARTVTALP